MDLECDVGEWEDLPERRGANGSLFTLALEDVEEGIAEAFVEATVNDRIDGGVAVGDERRKVRGAREPWRQLRDKSPKGRVTIMEFASHAGKSLKAHNSISRDHSRSPDSPAAKE